MDGGVGRRHSARDRVDHGLRLLRGGGGVEIGPARRDRGEIRRESRAAKSPSRHCRSVGRRISTHGVPPPTPPSAGGEMGVALSPQPTLQRRIDSASRTRLVLRSVERIGDEGAQSAALGLGSADAAAVEVEERLRVELADRRAMRAFHVVGEDLELGLGIDRRRALEQQPLQRLLAIGLLRVARDLDLAERDRRRLRPPSRAPDLAAGAVGRASWRMSRSIRPSCRCAPP